MNIYRILNGDTAELPTAEENEARSRSSSAPEENGKQDETGSAASPSSQSASALPSTSSSLSEPVAKSVSHLQRQQPTIHIQRRQRSSPQTVDSVFTPTASIGSAKESERPLQPRVRFAANPTDNRQAKRAGLVSIEQDTRKETDPLAAAQSAALEKVFDRDKLDLYREKQTTVEADGKVLATSTAQSVHSDDEAAATQKRIGSDEEVEEVPTRDLVAAKPKRRKAPNSTWTLEDDQKLVDMVLQTLPRQDFNEYAQILNKRDSQTVRYRWKVLVRRAKGLTEN